jgi:FAD binding domain
MMSDHGASREKSGVAPHLGFAVVRELERLLGEEAVSASVEDLRRHSHDVWPVTVKWQQQGKQPYRPDVVVRPSNTGQVRRLLAWAGREGVPATPWGLGSSVTGAPLAMRGGVVLDMSSIRRVLDVDETIRYRLRPARAAPPAAPRRCREPCNGPPVDPSPFDVVPVDEHGPTG